MMFCFLLLSSFVIVTGTENTFYPFIIPISTGKGYSHHTTHVFPHPVIRTQVLMLGPSDHHPQSNHDHLKKSYQKLPRTFKYGYNQYNDDIQNFKYGYNQYNDDISVNQPRNHDLSPNIKYSIPVEQSSWKPVQSIQLDYLPLRYLGEDGPAVAKVVYESLSSSKHNNVDDDEQGPLILPIGFKKLHNPQLRPSSRSKPKYFYGNTLTEGRHTNDHNIYKVQIGQKGTFVTSEHRVLKSIHCHCRMPKD